MAAKKDKPSESEKDILSLFGEDSIHMDGDLSSIGTYDIIKTGSSSLDFALGIGGIPRGRIIQFAGKESSGKTLLSLMCIKNWLDANPENTAMYIDAEYTYDPKWVKKLGIDTSRIIVAKTNEAKKIFEGLIGKVSVNKNTGKVSKSVRGVLDLVKEGTDPKFKNLGIIVVDSVAAMNTPVEAESVVGKQNMALMARFLSVELKKITPALAEANVSLIFINQLRSDPGVMYGNPETSPGGRALKHGCSVMVNLAALSSAESIIEDSNGIRIGHRVRAKVQKNKCGPPHRQAEYNIKYLEGIVSKNVEALDLGINIGLIERPNNRTYIVGDEKLSSRQIAEDYFLDDKIRIAFEETCREKYLLGNIDVIDAPDSNDSEDESEESLMDNIVNYEGDGE